MIDVVLFIKLSKNLTKNIAHGTGEIRTRAPEEIGALNQRLRPLGHGTHWLMNTGEINATVIIETKNNFRFFTLW